MFPRIETLEDVLPHISAEHGIYLNRRAGYATVDYAWVGDDTFDRPMRLECRGLKFDEQGTLLARPFHKFFNLGERERPEEVDWSRPHVILDKLDGSMVHPCRLAGRLTFMTRGGVTVQSEAALAFADTGAIQLSDAMLDAGVTPMFEFTAPDHRIVIAYDRPALTLLAARHNTTGRYFTHSELADLAARFSVPLVGELGTGGDVHTFIAGLRDLTGIEGYVVAFDDGHRLKLKTAFYALRHKALASLAFEKNILAWVVEGAVDDVIPLLSPDLAARVTAYSARASAAVNRQLTMLSEFVAEHAARERRDFAALVQAKIDKRLQPVAFLLRDGKDGRAAIRKILAWACQSDTRVDTLRDLFDLEWDSRGIELEAG